MFVSNLNQKMSQRFLVLVLLPHVRADIRNNRRLHFALFQVGRGWLALALALVPCVKGQGIACRQLDRSKTAVLSEHWFGTLLLPS